jgi:hypothetical protein
MGLAKPVFLDRIGAESAAKLVFDKFNDVFSKTEGGRVRVVKVECFENNKNSSIYYEDNIKINNTNQTINHEQHYGC